MTFYCVTVITVFRTFTQDLQRPPHFKYDFIQCLLKLFLLQNLQWELSILSGSEALIHCGG